MKNFYGHRSGNSILINGDRELDFCEVSFLEFMHRVMCKQYEINHLRLDSSGDISQIIYGDLL